MYLNANLKIHLVLKIKMIWFCIHDNEVNNISECNLLHDLINPLKHTKNLNCHYSPTLHGCMNTKGKLKFKNFEFYFIVDVVPQF